MHKKPLTELQSKEKESSPLSIGVASSRVPTEVDYTTTIDPKTTPDKWNNMGNSEKYVYGKIEGNKYLESTIK